VSLEPATIEHLLAAEENRELALSLLDRAASSVRPRRWEWTGVVAFYAAVHYVNAYLWEVRRFAPTSHQARSDAFHVEADLRPARSGYWYLRDFAYEARYRPSVLATEAIARDLVDIDLRTVETAVRRSLGLDIPAWQLPASG